MADTAFRSNDCETDSLTDGQTDRQIQEAGKDSHTDRLLIIIIIITDTHPLTSGVCCLTVTNHTD